MIDDVLWFLWTVGEVAAVMLGWVVLIVVVRGFLRGARQAVRESQRGTNR